MVSPVVVRVIAQARREAKRLTKELEQSRSKAEKMVAPFKALKAEIAKTKIGKILSTNISGALLGMITPFQKIKAIFGDLKDLILKFKDQTLGAIQEIEQGTRSAAVTIAQSVDIIDKAGNRLDTVGQKLDFLVPKLKQVQENLIEAAPGLVGVTTRDLLNTFNEVSIQFGNIAGQVGKDAKAIFGDSIDDFGAAEEITKRLAVAMKAYGLRTRDVAQEVRALFTGDIDINARLANQLGITRQQILAAKAQGDQVGFIARKLDTLAQSNDAFGQSLENTLSVLQDIFDSFGRAIGRPVFEGLQESLLTFRTTLESFRPQIEAVGEAIGKIAGAQIAANVQYINNLFDYFLNNLDAVEAVAGLVINSIGDMVRWFVEMAAAIVMVTESWQKFTLEIKNIGDVFQLFFQGVDEGAQKGWASLLKFIGFGEQAQDLLDELTGKEYVIDVKFKQQGIQGLELLSDQFAEKGALANFWDFINFKGAADNFEELWEGEGKGTVEEAAIRDIENYMSTMKKHLAGMQTLQEMLDEINWSEVSEKDIMAFEDRFNLLQSMIKENVRAGRQAVTEASLELLQFSGEASDELKKKIIDGNKLIVESESKSVDLRIAFIEKILGEEITADQQKQLLADKELARTLQQQIADRNLRIEKSRSSKEAKALQDLQDADAEKLVELNKKLLKQQEELTRGFRTIPIVAKDIGNTFDVTVEGYEAALNALKAGAKDPETNFKNLGAAVKLFSDKLKVAGVTAQDLTKLWDDFNKIVNTLTPEQRVQSIEKILKLEKEVVAARKEQMKVQETDIELAVARGFLSTQEAVLEKEQLQRQEKAFQLQQKIKNIKELEALGIKGALIEEEKAKARILDKEISISKAKEPQMEFNAEVAKAERERRIRVGQITEKYQELTAELQTQAAKGLIDDDLEKAIQGVIDYEEKVELLGEAEKNLKRIQEEKIKLQEKGIQISQKASDEIRKQEQDAKKAVRDLRLDKEKNTKEIKENLVNAWSTVIQKIADYNIGLIDAKNQASEIAQGFKQLELDEISFEIQGIDTFAQAQEALDKTGENFKNLTGTAKAQLESIVGKLGGTFNKFFKNGKKNLKASLAALKKEQKVRAEIAAEEQERALNELEQAQIQNQAEQDMLALKMEFGETEIGIEQRKLQTLEIQAQLLLDSKQITQDQFDNIMNMTGGILKNSKAAEQGLQSQNQLRKQELELRAENLKAEIELLKAQGAENAKIQKKKDLLEQIQHIMQNTPAGGDLGGVGGQGGGLPGGDAFQNMSGQAFTIQTNILEGVSKEGKELYKKTWQRLGEDAWKIWNEAFRKGQDEIPTRRSHYGSIDFGNFMEKQNRGTKRAVRAIINSQIMFEKKVEEEKMLAQKLADEQKERDARAQAKRQKAIDEANRRAEEAQERRETQRELLEELIAEAKQARLDRAKEARDRSLESQEFIDTFKEGIIPGDLTRWGLLFQDAMAQDVTDNVKDEQAFAALAEKFGEEAAKRLSGLVDIDQRIVDALEEGNVKQSDLIQGNKVFLDPTTGEVILTGKDPDFDKLNELIQIDALRTVNESQLSVLESIDASLDPEGFIFKAIQAGIIDRQGRVFATKRDPETGKTRVLTDEQDDPIPIGVIDVFGQTNEQIAADLDKVVSQGAASLEEFQSLGLATEKTLMDVNEDLTGSAIDLENAAATLAQNTGPQMAKVFEDHLASAGQLDFNNAQVERFEFLNNQAADQFAADMFTGGDLQAWQNVKAGINANPELAEDLLTATALTASLDTWGEEFLKSLGDRIPTTDPNEPGPDEPGPGRGGGGEPADEPAEEPVEVTPIDSSPSTNTGTLGGSAMEPSKNRFSLSTAPSEIRGGVFGGASTGYTVPVDEETGARGSQRSNTYNIYNYNYSSNQDEEALKANASGQ